MQTRTITVDYDRPRGYDLGYSGENNFVELVLPVPPELSNADCYRVYFETTTGESRQTDIEQAVEGAVTVTLTADLAPEPGTVVAQLVAFADGDIIGKAPVIYGTVKQSISEGTELDGHTIAAEVTANTLARHTHSNKTVLDSLSTAEGKLKYNGSDVGLKGDKGDTGAKGDKGDKGDPGSDATVTQSAIVAALGGTPITAPKQYTSTAGTVSYTLEDNAEYRLTDALTMTLTYPTGNFECWMRVKFAASGTITVTLPSDTEYIGSAPSFANGEAWELSIKDGVLVAQKVGNGI